MTSTLLNYSLHLDLSLPSNLSRFLSICLPMSPLPIALDTPCCTASVIAAVIFAGSGLLVVPCIGNCTAVLLLVQTIRLFHLEVGWPWGGILGCCCC